jgi:hypothetical protein
MSKSKPKFAAVSLVHAITLPKAFSVRDDHEFEAFRHLMIRLNSKLRVEEVGQGLHANGGTTVYWGIVHAEDVRPTKEQVLAVLAEAGFDKDHNGAVIQWD